MLSANNTIIRLLLVAINESLSFILMFYIHLSVIITIIQNDLSKSKYQQISDKIINSESISSHPRNVDDNIVWCVWSKSYWICDHECDESVYYRHCCAGYIQIENNKKDMSRSTISM